MEYEIKCPCCNNKIKIQIGDDGEISVVSLIEIKDLDKLQELLIERGIEFGQGGEI